MADDRETCWQIHLPAELALPAVHVCPRMKSLGIITILLYRQILPCKCLSRQDTINRSAEEMVLRFIHEWRSLN
jgi:hypothetical protein